MPQVIQQTRPVQLNLLYGISVNRNNQDTYKQLILDNIEGYRKDITRSAILNTGNLYLYSINSDDQPTQALAGLTDGLTNLYLFSFEFLRDNNQLFNSELEKSMAVLESRYKAYENLGKNLSLQLNELQKNGGSLAEQKILINRLLNIFDGLNDINYFGTFNKNSALYAKHGDMAVQVKRNIFEQLFKSGFAEYGLDIDRYNDLSVYLKKKFSREEQPYWLALFTVGRHNYVYNDKFYNASSFFRQGTGDCSEFGVFYVDQLKKLGFEPKMFNLYFHPAYQYSTNQNGHALVVLEDAVGNPTIMDNRGFRDFQNISSAEAVFQFMPQTDYFREFYAEKLNQTENTPSNLLLSPLRIENRNFQRNTVPGR